MRQHRALSNSGRPPCILQGGKVITICLHWQIEHLDSTLCVRLQHAAHSVQHLIFMQLLLGQRRLWMMGTKLCKWKKPLQYWRQVVGNTCDNDMLQRGIRTHGTHNWIEYIEHHYNTRPRIRQLMLHLTLSIAGIGWCDHCAGTQCTVKGDGKLRNIRKRNSDAITLFD